MTTTTTTTHSSPNTSGRRFVPPLRFAGARIPIPSSGPPRPSSGHSRPSFGPSRPSSGHWRPVSSPSRSNHQPQPPSSESQLSLPENSFPLSGNSLPTSSEDFLPLSAHALPLSAHSYPLSDHARLTSEHTPTTSELYPHSAASTDGRTEGLTDGGRTLYTMPVGDEAATPGSEEPLSISLENLFQRFWGFSSGVDGQWGQWSEWSECSATCGEGGHRHRRRLCNSRPPSDGGAECKGRMSQRRRCDANPSCEVCAEEPSLCARVMCPNGRSFRVLKQLGTINQMSCCKGQVHNMTQTFCDKKFKLRKCSLDEEDSFQCDNLSCIDKSKLCDGANDCSDGSDEAGCNRCDKDHFRCGTTNQCVALSLVCDSNKDCGDGTDETNCVRSRGDWCRTDQFWCSVSDDCVNLNRVCDGRKDCDEGEDEEGCAAHCDEAVQSCVSMTCPSGARGWTLPAQQNTTHWGCCQGNVFNKRTHICTGVGTKRCRSFSAFFCSEGNCVPSQWRCDGDNDCSDGSDEVGCAHCSEDEFQCSKTLACIPKSLVCDGALDCVDSGADETGCATTSGHWCGPKQFACKNSKCVPGSGVCNGRDDCGDASDEENCSVEFLGRPTAMTNENSTLDPRDLLPSECGERAFAADSFISRIIGGTKAQRGSWPWQVQLWNAHIKGYCGAALVSSDWIVTAAHCVYIQNQLYHVDIRSFDDLLVYLKSETIVKVGKHNSKIDEEFEELFRVDEVIPHPDYEGADHRNDIALMKLSRRADFASASHIRPICLGTKDFYQRKVFDHLGHFSGWVAGWGSLRAGGGSTAVLQEVHLPLVPRSVCRRALSPRPVAGHMFCAGFRSGGRDTCQGDSGGPYMIDIEGRWHLLGVISWGRGCALPNRYGVYMNVGFFYDWILNTMKEYED